MIVQIFDSPSYSKQIEKSPTSDYLFMTSCFNNLTYIIYTMYVCKYQLE